MAISSGRKKPGAYDECDYESLLWFKLFIDGLNPAADGYETWKNLYDLSFRSYETWKKLNDLSSKMVIDNTSPPVFKPYWLDSDDQTES